VGRLFRSFDFRYSSSMAVTSTVCELEWFSQQIAHPNKAEFRIATIKADVRLIDEIPLTYTWPVRI